MAISAQKTQSEPRELAPKGAHQAVLIGIKNEGMCPAFDTTKPDVPKLSFVWEIATLNSKGEPCSFYFWKTNSSFYSPKNGKMSGLIEMLTQWLDVPASDLTPNLLDDLELLCGLNARVRLTHKPKQDGDLKCEMVSIEPWEDGAGALIEPSREWGDSGFFPAKSFKTFWGEVRSGNTSQSKAAPPRPAPAPTEPTKGELPLSGVMQAQIKTMARSKLADDGVALQEVCSDSFGKKFEMLSADEGAQLLHRLRALKDFQATGATDAEDDFDPFADEGESDAETAKRMLAPQEAPVPARRNAKAASEAYGA